MPRSALVSRSQRELTYGPGEPALLSVGDLRMVARRPFLCGLVGDNGVA